VILTTKSATKHMYVASVAAGLMLLAVSPAFAQQRYQRPPQKVLELLDAPTTPIASVSPARDRILLVQTARNPTIADLSEPMLRIAGLRLNPNTNGPHLATRAVSLTLKEIAGGKQLKLATPSGARLGFPAWSNDGKLFAFTNTTSTGIELWVGDSATGALKRIPGVLINAAYGEPIQWMADSRSLLCQTVSAKRGTPPAEPRVPLGPNVQESYGKAAPVRTYEDLLKNAHDEDLFDYYATSQLVIIDLQTMHARPLGTPAIYQSSQWSPDGRHLLIERIHRPYSYLLPAGAFPKEVEVWDRTGKVEHKLASLPLEDQVPIDGVPAGPRSYQWLPVRPATLVWVEALDGGDPKKKVDYRDHVLELSAPFSTQPVELAKTQHRFQGLTWGEKGAIALLRDFDRNRRWTRTFVINVDNPGQPRPIWDRSIQDRYNDPGLPLMKQMPGGLQVMIQSGDNILLRGTGATPGGDRPFLDRFNLGTLKSERLFRSDDKSYESVSAVLADDGSSFVTRYERSTEPPNYFVRRAGSTARQALTSFEDPTPQLRAIKKQLVTYKRADGVQLSFTLYLPPDYKEGQRLPTVVWAYPIEFTDAGTASQVSGSANRFTTINGISHLFFVLQGYAVLDDATMPVVGDPQTMNNTYVEQIVASAQAAIDKAVEMGVTDRNRVGVGGHSYGAFMTANLLAHSNLFRAGIARSGAYNRTLTAFGFQNERRTLWEAPELYLKVSPFMYADKIKAPILLIHGEADNNSGTFPIQSERMYQALKGNGGNVRYVTLPYEAHGYSARESVEHTLWEMINWFDKYVKNAVDSPPAATGGGK
jgi:dipeptidyl aminopeptidase/acylaminoacyl peptidase